MQFRDFTLRVNSVWFPGSDIPHQSCLRSPEMRSLFRALHSFLELEYIWCVSAYTSELPDELKQHVVSKGDQRTDFKTHTAAPNHITNAKPASRVGVE